ncbi:MAG: HU family DNA-binding protein [Phocaeicola massiliensis]
MAILFDWYENPQSSEQQGEENALHPRLRLNGKMSTSQLRARIQKRCTLTETDVIAVLDALSHAMGEELADGKQVHLDGIGFFRPNLVSTEPVTEKTKYKNTKVKLKGIVYRPDQALLDEVGRIKVQRTKFPFHSARLTVGEIDALLTEYFVTHDFVLRKSFQLLCGMTQTTANRHLHRLCEEGKLENAGLPKQPVYKPVNGHYVVND